MEKLEFKTFMLYTHIFRALRDSKAAGSTPHNNMTMVV
ncbi:hypothetical protein ABENE_09295 [Asticcacaulis benevestitus DSM 16100 = ATCC BAA-896]|uniref:Uncharacterized protein n=1 Tax=Asticcacaulis benevestitus DSM 16100 = ATCC BAA-896 TaxID=1121022 RepID=V4PD10_9CAUL|nr:hypothetical protein ABENE_09295 [Asticcacaulis benevestitus DSM 16100 = ATCC BAA-896]